MTSIGISIILNITTIASNIPCDLRLIIEANIYIWSIPCT